MDTLLGVCYNKKARFKALVTVLALENWKLEKEMYPENLTELIIAGYLEELPMDPYSDKPLVYKKTDDGFILYSIGEDFKDDGGKADYYKSGRIKRAYDRVFWPVGGIN